MSLLFTGLDGDRVNHGSGATLDNIAAGTALVWMYCTDVTPADGNFLACKGSGVVGGTRKALLIRGPGVSNNVSWEMSRATAVLHAQATQANLTGFGENKWVCLAATWNTAGADGDQHLYSGDLATRIAEAGAYAVQTVGSGAVGDDSAADQFIGNSVGAVNSFFGRIAVAAIWNRQLSLGELQAQQFRPHPTSGCVLFGVLGYDNATTVPDWSGNGNNGTVTGATVADHVPIAFRRASQVYVPYAVAAAPAGAFPQIFRSRIFVPTQFRGAA